MATLLLYHPESVNKGALAKVLIDPFELGSYYFRDYYKVLGLFSNNQQVTYEDILSSWGPDSSSVIGLILDDGQKILPLVGPIETSYYDGLVEEGNSIKNRLQEIDNKILNISLGEEYLGEKNEFMNTDTVWFRMKSELFMEKDTDTYNVSISMESFLGTHGIKLMFYMVSNKVLFFDKTHNTKIEINYLFHALGPELQFGGSNNTTQKASFYVIDSVMPLFLLGLIVFKKKAFRIKK